jgi:hypothetical protein
MTRNKLFRGIFCWQKGIYFKFISDPELLGSGMIFFRIRSRSCLKVRIRPDPVVCPHWFQCGCESGSRILGECGSENSSRSGLGSRVVIFNS